MEASQIFGGTVGVVVAIFGLVLFVATVLLPLYVISLHDKMTRMEAVMRELLQYKRLEMGVSDLDAEEILRASRPPRAMPQWTWGVLAAVVLLILWAILAW